MRLHHMLRHCPKEKPAQAGRAAEERDDDRRFLLAASQRTDELGGVVQEAQARGDPDGSDNGGEIKVCRGETVTEGERWVYTE